MRFSVADFARAFVLLSFSQALAGASCGPGAPPPDSCDTPMRSGEIAQIEVGANEDDFRAFAEGTEVPVEVGGQGATMLPVRFRFTGRDIPECLQVDLVIARFGSSTSTMSYQLNTYGDGGAQRDTEPLYIILGRESYYGAAVLKISALGARYDFDFKFPGGVPEYYQVELAPEQLSVAPGDSAIFKVTRREYAEIPFVLSSSYPKISLPIEPEGLAAKSFRVRVAESAVFGDHADFLLSHPAGEVGSQILVTSAATPRAGDLMVGELMIRRDLFGFPNVESEDANCDGTVDALNDQFIELLNRTNTSLQLEGIELVYTTTSAPQEEKIGGVFPARTVGPNENVVIFSGAIGNSSLNPAPRCGAYTADWVNDAVAAGGAGFDLREATSLKLRFAGTEILSVAFTREEYGLYEVDERNLTEAQPPLIENPYYGIGSPGETSSGEPFVELSPP